MSEDRILLVLPLPIYKVGDQSFIDTQAANNLARFGWTTSNTSH